MCTTFFLGKPPFSWKITAMKFNFWYQNHLITKFNFNHPINIDRELGCPLFLGYFEMKIVIFDLKSTKMPHLCRFSTAKITKMSKISRFYGMWYKLITMSSYVKLVVNYVIFIERRKISNKNYGFWIFDLKEFKFNFQSMADGGRV